MKNKSKKIDNITPSENLRNQNKMGKPCAHCNTRDRKSVRVPTSEEMELAWVELKEQITCLFRRDLVSTIPPSIVTRMMQISETLLLGDLYQLLLRFKSLISRLIIENKNSLNRIFTKKISCKALAFCLLEHVIQNFKVMVNSGKALQKCLIKLQNKIHVDIYVLCVNLFRLYYFEDLNIQEKITQSLDSLSSVVKLEVTSTLNDARLEIKVCAQQWPSIEQIIKKLSEKPENTKKKKVVKEVKNTKETQKKNNKPNSERCTALDCSQSVQDTAKKSERHNITISASATANNTLKTSNVSLQNNKSTKNVTSHSQLHTVETSQNKQLENQTVSKHTLKKSTNSGTVPLKEKNVNDSRDIDSLVAFINGKNLITDHTKSQKAREKKKLKKEKRKLKKIEANTIANANLSILTPVHEISHVQISKNVSLKSDHCIVSKESNTKHKFKEPNVSKPIENNKKEKNKKKAQEKGSITSTTCTQTVSQNHAELLAKLQRSSQVSISAVSTNCSQPSNKDFRSSVKDITAQISTITVSPRCDAPFPITNNNNNINKQFNSENSGNTNGSRMVSIKRIDSSARGPTVTMTVKGENSTDKIYYLMRNGQADTKTYNMFRNINNAEKEKSTTSHATALKTISFDNSEITLSNSRNKSSEYCNTDTLKLSKYLNEIEIIPIPNPVSDENLESCQNEGNDTKSSKKRKKNKKKKNAIENQCSIISCSREQPVHEITKKQIKLKTNISDKQIKIEASMKKNKNSKIVNEINNVKDKNDLNKLKKQNSNIQIKNVNVKNVNQSVVNQKSSKKQIDVQQKSIVNTSKYNQSQSKKETKPSLINNSNKISNSIPSNGKKKKSQKKSKEINPEDLQLPGGITVIKLKSGENGMVSKTKTTLDSVTKIKNNRKINNPNDQKFRQPVNPFNYSYFSQDQTSTWNNNSGVEFGSQDLLTYFNQKLSFGAMQNNPQLIHPSQSYLQPKVMQTSVGASYDNMSNYETIDSRHAKTAVPPRHDFESRRHDPYDHSGNYWPMHFGADNVFAPKEGIDPTTLDAEEAEIEQFKRFCNEPVSRARREPTHLNMTGIFKKKQ